jgi:hypothetical protein
MKLDWEAIPSSSSHSTHPVILRTRLPHGWLVASQVHGGFSVTFVPDPPRDDDADWSIVK